MDANMSDKDQVDMLKRWWRSYGKAITVALAIGLIIGFGWKYYRDSKTQHAEEAAMVFQRLAIADDKDKTKEVKLLAERLIADYADTPYAALANLIMAHEAVQNQQLASAETSLKWVTQHAKANTLRQIARLRLARVLMARFKAKAALVVLQTVDDKTYKPMINNLKGDAYALLNKPKKAVIAYRSAQQGYKDLGVPNPILDMKIAM